jgi:CheY-like chemotaxis protein
LLQLSGGNACGVREIKNSSRCRQAAEGNRLAYETLVYRGLCYFTYSTGAGAIKVIKEHAPDVVLLEIDVLLDIDLSAMGGIGLVRAIREDPVRAGTTIIAIGAFPYMKVMCLDNGCDDFIKKPIKALDLLTQLRKLTKV